MLLQTCSADTLGLPAVTINQNRQVTGVLRGFDQFMNVVLDSTVDEKAKSDIGMVVRVPLCTALVLMCVHSIADQQVPHAGDQGQQHCVH